MTVHTVLTQFMHAVKFELAGINNLRIKSAWMSLLKYIKPLTYSKKELLIMLVIMPPIALVLNFFLFGGQYFTNGRTFLLATLLTLSVLVLVYISCGMVAVVLLNRFPKYHQSGIL